MLEAEDLAFLEDQPVARLATVDDAGRPTIVPVCFAQQAGRLYIPIDAKPKRGNPRELKRLRNIRAHPEVALLVDRYDDDWRRLRWLSIHALASILEDGDERAAALARLERRYRQYTAMRLASLGLPVITLTPTAIQRWSASRSDNN